MFNEHVPIEAGFINELLTKKSLRGIISHVLNSVGVPRTAQFLDDIKELGFTMAFKGGLSFNLNDVIIPPEKSSWWKSAKAQVGEVMDNYNMGLITNNERYNQIIDIWTHTNSRLDQHPDGSFGDRQARLQLDLHDDALGCTWIEGADSSVVWHAWLDGQASEVVRDGRQDIIENPILSNFKEGLSILEYFISTHGARKGLADTALKTADAGYLTRRLVDVAQDVIITEEDCHTLRGVTLRPFAKNDEITEGIGDRIEGRTALNDVEHPKTGEIMVAGGEEIDFDTARPLRKRVLTKLRCAPY
jgi:DNA-directed RNA polymerase subunit beta'